MIMRVEYRKSCGHDGDVRGIWLVVGSYFPTPESWRCSFVYDQVRAIERTGRYRVVVVNTDREGDYVHGGVHVLGMKCIRRGNAFAPRLYGAINFMRLKKCLAKHGIGLMDISVAQAHLAMCGDLVRRIKCENPKVKAIVQMHDLDPYGPMLEGFGHNPFGWRRVLCYLYHRRVIESVDAVVAVSSQVADALRTFPRQRLVVPYKPMERAMRDLRHCRSGCPRRILILHNGVDRRLFFPSHGHDKVRQDLNTVVIGCVGNFTAGKNQITLIKAVISILRIQDCRLRVRFVGTGPCLEDCRSFAEKSGFAEVFSFEGERGHEEMPDFFRQIDLFVLPSFFDACACVFLEAYACGVPFIAGAGYGMDDFISDNDRDKWLCRPFDVEDLASKLLNFIRTRPQQRLSREFDIDRLVPQFVQEVEGLA